MKVEDTRSNRLLTIHDIKVGDAFEYNLCIFMKVNSSSENERNAVCLETGDTYSFREQAIRLVKNAKVVVEDD